MKKNDKKKQKNSNEEEVDEVLASKTKSQRIREAKK